MSYLLLFHNSKQQHNKIMNFLVLHALTLRLFNRIIKPLV